MYLLSICGPICWSLCCVYPLNLTLICSSSRLSLLVYIQKWTFLFPDFQPPIGWTWKYWQITFPGEPKRCNNFISCNPLLSDHLQFILRKYVLNTHIYAYIHIYVPMVNSQPYTCIHPHTHRYTHIELSPYNSVTFIFPNNFYHLFHKLQTKTKIWLLWLKCIIYIWNKTQKFLKSRGIHLFLSQKKNKLTGAVQSLTPHKQQLPPTKKPPKMIVCFLPSFLFSLILQKKKIQEGSITSSLSWNKLLVHFSPLPSKYSILRDF